MAKERQDMSRLMSLVTHGALSLKQANLFAALPLMIIPSKVHTNIEDWKTFNKGSFHFIPSVQKFMLHELMVLYGTRDKDVVRYANIRIVDDTTYRVSIQVRDDLMVLSELKYRENDHAMYVKIRRVNGKSVDDICDQLKLSANVVREIHTQSAAAVATLQLWCEFNNRRDHFMVSTRDVEDVPEEVASTESTDKPSSEKVKTETEKSIFGPTIVYLDQAKLDQMQTHMRGIGIVMPHVRRGHFFTLMDERYKKNPMYRVHKALYRKPTYVGDRRFIKNGTIYTVLDA